jgi:cobyrinic acid a,c-diamide synthase
MGLILDVEIRGRTKNKTAYKTEVKIRGVIKDEVGGDKHKKRVNRRWKTE